MPRPAPSRPVRFQTRWWTPYAISGPPGYCAERILEWISLGYTRISLSVESPDADREVLALSHRLIAEKVLPEVRRSLPTKPVLT